MALFCDALRRDSVSLLKFAFLSGICRPSHDLDKCSTRTFLNWVRAQGGCLDALGIPKNALGPVGISVKKERLRCLAISLTPPKRVKTLGDGPLRLDVCPVIRHTLPDLCRPKCVSSTEFSWLKSTQLAFLSHVHVFSSLSFSLQLLQVLFY